MRILIGKIEEADYFRGHHFKKGPMSIASMSSSGYNYKEDCELKRKVICPYLLTLHLTMHFSPTNPFSLPFCAIILRIHRNPKTLRPRMILRHPARLIIQKIVGLL